MITIEDFKKIELVNGKIIEARDHPNADRLFVLKVDIGSEQRQLVAGIRKSYAAEQLIGHKVVIVKNLEPAVIRGEESQGMVLAVSDEQGISLLQPDRDVALGNLVK